MIVKEIRCVGGPLDGRIYRVDPERTTMRAFGLLQRRYATYVEDGTETLGRDKKAGEATPHIRDLSNRWWTNEGGGYMFERPLWRWAGWEWSE